MSITLDTIRSCLEGAVPAVIATCAPDGMPNVAYLSQVHFVDNAHVALSFQFFNKTRENVLANPRAIVQVVDPDTTAHYRLSLRYLRTETEGPLFENMKAKLAGIASHTGMSKVFRLQGSDVYEVLDIERVPGKVLPAPIPQCSVLSALRLSARRIAACTELGRLFDEALASLEEYFAIEHAMLLMLDDKAGRLYTVASRGYAESGVGSEIALGDGVIGVAARERTPIRIGYMAREYQYGRAVRKAFEEEDPAVGIETEIPLPGLPAAHSQLAAPLLLGARVLGVLYVESPQDLRFTYEHEDALAVFADHLATAIHTLEQTAEAGEEHVSTHAPAASVSGAPAAIRRYTVDNSVFIDGDYLIKGVAGAIFWKLVQDYSRNGRTEFTNRELRLDPAIPLPDLSDNLEARLILLQRRLAERCRFLNIQKTGRGRFRLRVDRPIELSDVPCAQAR